MSILTTLASISGVIGAIAVLPQVYKIFKRKSAKDIAILSYFIFLSSNIIWILYGFEIQSFPIIISSVIGGLNVILVIIGWALYGREKKN